MAHKKTSPTYIGASKRIFQF